jgi:hypothetical protein
MERDTRPVAVRRAPPGSSAAPGTRRPDVRVRRGVRGDTLRVPGPPRHRLGAVSPPAHARDKMARGRHTVARPQPGDAQLVDKDRAWRWHGAGITRAHAQPSRRRTARRRRRSAAVHHSITSLARAMSVGGTASPCARAVLRLRTQLEPGRILNRQVGRPCAFEDTVDIQRSRQCRQGGRVIANLVGEAVQRVESDTASPS